MIELSDLSTDIVWVVAYIFARLRDGSLGEKGVRGDGREMLRGLHPKTH